MYFQTLRQRCGTLAFGRAAGHVERFLWMSPDGSFVTYLAKHQGTPKKTLPHFFGKTYGWGIRAWVPPMKKWHIPPVGGQAFDGDLDTMSLLIKAGADVNVGIPRLGLFW